MPNIRGGKSYKKSKGKTKFGEDDEVAYIEVGKDQMVGRLVRLLGNLNATIYCQDNKQRICKICRSIKKSVRFEVGDVVLISLRDCEVSTSDLTKGIRGDKGDILDKFHPKQFNELKESGVNPSIFLTIDSVNEITSKIEIGDEEGARAIAEKAEEDLFDRAEEDDESAIDIPQETILGAGIVKKEKSFKAPVKRKNSDDIDIDAI